MFSPLKNERFAQFSLNTISDSLRIGQTHPRRQLFFQVLLEPPYKTPDYIDAVRFLIHAAGVGLPRIDDQLSLYTQITQCPVELNSLGQDNVRVPAVGEDQGRGLDVLDVGERGAALTGILRPSRHSRAERGGKLPSLPKSNLELLDIQIGAAIGSGGRNPGARGNSLVGVCTPGRRFHVELLRPLL